MLSGCSGGTDAPEPAAPSAAPCPPGAVADLRRAARQTLNRLEFSFPEVKRLFRAALDGKKRVSAGTDVRLPVEGVFREVAAAIDGSRRGLAAALEETKGCARGTAARGED